MEFQPVYFLLLGRGSLKIDSSAKFSRDQEAKNASENAAKHPTETLAMHAKEKRLI